ncbi:MAG: triple tyrosine motif-containing protein [Wenyingzhuangia sp.]|uniref:triple tyrosine motif-containing protein n=1 Tax=Wenyingzhuangia sp. TaxID=1964193 RepID=UPI00321BC05B
MSKLLFPFLFLSFNFLFAQELPPISVYSSEYFDAGNQNWAISQSEDKHIYIANNKGLIEFDGSSSKLYPTPNETIMRSVKVLGEKIFTGFYTGFGYWTKNNSGLLEYTSLSENIDLLEDEQFWHIEALEGWMLFQSLKRIYLYNIVTQEYKVITAHSQINSMFKVRGRIYYQDSEKGIFRLDNGLSKLVSDQKVFKEHDVISILDVNDRLIYVTANEGIFYLQDGEIKEWNVDLNKSIKDDTLYSAIKLSSGDLVLGSISNGVIIVDSKANIKYKINQKKGLSDNTILSLFEDLDENIWLGLDDGINTINLNSPFRVYTDVSGVLGTVYASIVHKGMIYLGTNQGLFCREETDENFTFVEKTEGQVWTLKAIGEDLFCGHNIGTFKVENQKATLIGDVMGTWKIESLSRDTFIQGNYSGLYVFHKTNREWTLKNKIQGFNISSRYFERLNKNTIFINHEYKGVYKLTINDDYTKVSNVSILVSVDKGIHSALLKYKGDILYSYQNGVYKYNVKKDLFIKDTLLSNYTNTDNFISGVLINVPSENKLWGFSKKNICYIEQGGVSEIPIINQISIPLKQRKGAFGFENINGLSKYEYLIGTSEGYLIVNLKNKNRYKTHRVEINQIKNSALNEEYSSVELSSGREYINKNNNFEFRCSTPSYNDYHQVEYQYQLEGLSAQWSEWGSSGVVVFKNLPFGNYTFKVRSKMNGNLSSNVATYGFDIQKPWYISNPMIITYVVIVFLFSVFMHIMYNLYYAKQRKDLLMKKQKEFDLDNLEKEQELTLLKNERLEADIKLKSKELASSTMSIIKKNELLNTIKTELLKGEKNDVSNVINIVEKNLNNNNDWKLFEEAFNNADKDFIKKAKSLHPLLTSNDLRLCAYLRLNLSSKEIAPLLNISAKSVEVKRYRLRKKMGLSSETNLVDYILNM